MYFLLATNFRLHFLFICANFRPIVYFVSGPSVDTLLIFPSIFYLDCPEHNIWYWWGWCHNCIACKWPTLKHNLTWPNLTYKPTYHLQTYNLLTTLCECDASPTNTVKRGNIKTRGNFERPGQH